MLQDNNLYAQKGESFGRSLPCPLAASERVELGHTNRTDAGSVDVYLDPNGLEIQATIDKYVSAFGGNYVEVERISGEAALLKVYPGGARELSK